MSTYRSTYRSDDEPRSVANNKADEILSLSAIAKSDADKAFVLAEMLQLMLTDYDNDYVAMSADQLLKPTQ